ncbi:MAG: peptide-methionine (S)-S-oxide reductase MsrA [Gemmatimonadaceae bacterium]
MNALATFGGGCFWCLDGAIRQLRGVEKIVSGYAGGKRPNPTYEQVCSGTTGHAEVVQISFDPSIITYRDLLGVLFTIHDPTTLNRQGSDIGTQYRSVIFYHSPEQEQDAKEVIRELESNKVWEDPIVTEVVPYSVFYPAEGYHQDYFNKNPNQPYCSAVVAPKVSKIRKAYFDRLVKA